MESGTTLYLFFSLLVAYLVHNGLGRVVRCRKIRQLGCQPPPSVPQQDPLFGLDHVFKILQSFRKHRRNLSLKEQVDSLGRTFKSTPYGTTRIFSIEPQNLQSVFSTDSQNWGIAPLRKFAFGALIGDGIMTTDGDSWEISWNLLRPMMSKSQIADMKTLKMHTDQLLNLIPTDGSTVDLQPLFSRFSIDTVSEFIFGKSLHTLSPIPSSEGREFAAAFRYGQQGVGRRMQLPQWNIFTQDGKFWASCKSVRLFVDSSIEKAKEQSLSNLGDNKDGPYIFVHELVKQTQMSRKEMQSQLLNIFLPAHDATGVALTNIFFHLARHPDIWTRLRAEAQSLGSDNMSVEKVKGLKYLQNVINETLRLNPPVSTMARVALRDTTLPKGGGPGGKAPIYVRKGDIFATSFWALHRTQEIYGDSVDEFLPERWETIRPGRWNFLPFGGGSRICPGQQFALAEASYVIVRLAQRFKYLENRDSVEAFVEQYKIVTESKNGARVALIYAEKNGR